MNRLIQWIAIVLVVLINVSSVRGQEDEQHIDRLLLRQTLTQAEIYNLNADGSTTLIATLDDVGIVPGVMADWNVLVSVDIALSPDGQHIAFTAAQRYENPTLFIVSLNPLRVRQFETPDIARVEWSPTGDALLLDRPSIYIGGRIGESGKIYVFDLATETHTLVVENNESWTVDHSTWSPTGEDIIVAGSPRVNPDELHIRELYIVSRDGSDWHQLTNLAVDAPQWIDFEQPRKRDICPILDMKWSGYSSRIYYVIGCGEDGLLSLFSVDLEGKNRLEVDFPEYFPDEFIPLAEMDLRSFVDMFVEEDVVYLVVNSPYQSDMSPYHHVYAVRVDGPEQAEIIAAIPGVRGLFAAISENGSKLAISTTANQVAELDLTTNELSILDLADRENSVCRVQWLDDTILIDEVSTCGLLNPQFFRVRNVLAWTPEAGTLESITDTLGDGIKLIIPLPEVPEILLDGIAEP